ncbi:hypothetical protein [Nonomuraea dietziae]|uniref:hypothetical protein n=1 Tax=Nonomuraea dietziae TaxID=65515 RepID=UPI0031DA0AB8
MPLKLYAYAFLGDFILLYPVYALLFSDSGLTVPEITSLLVIWAASGLLLEVPSGALADTLSRRALLVAAPPARRRRLRAVDRRARLLGLRGRVRAVGRS